MQSDEAKREEIVCLWEGMRSANYERLVIELYEKVPSGTFLKIDKKHLSNRDIF